MKEVEKRVNSYTLEPHSGLRFNRDHLKKTPPLAIKIHLSATMYPFPVMRPAFEKMSFKEESVWIKYPI